MKAMKVSERMRGYRARKQASGLRLIQLWVPDTRSKRFAAECRRQATAASRAPRGSSSPIISGNSRA